MHILDSTASSPCELPLTTAVHQSGWWNVSSNCDWPKRSPCLRVLHTIRPQRPEVNLRTVYWKMLHWIRKTRSFGSTFKMRKAFLSDSMPKDWARMLVCFCLWVPVCLRVCLSGCLFVSHDLCWFVNVMSNEITSWAMQSYWLNNVLGH